MINLIPSSAKRSIAFEYWIRVASVGILVLCGILVTSTLLLLPVYVRIHSHIKAYEAVAGQATEKASEYSLSSATLIQTGIQARLLLGLKNQQSFSSIIDMLENLENSSISITSFNLSKSGGELQPIEITGKALTRQALADFREALLGHEAIDTVFLPISNLAQDRDISFTVTITLKKPE